MRRLADMKNVYNAINGLSILLFVVARQLFSEWSQ
jgi:hypothetical protein